MKRLLFIPFVLFFAVLFTEGSIAEPVFDDIRANPVFDEEGITSGTIESGDGGALEMIFCGIPSEGSNPFNLPTPGSWNEINNSTCSLDRCQSGIWWRTTSPGNSEEITCSWGDDSVSLVNGSIRFSNVDQENPIIDYACSEVVGNNLVIDSVSSEPGAALVTVSQFTSGGTIPGGGDTFTDILSEGSIVGFLSGAVGDNEDNILLTVEAGIDEDGEGFSGVTVPIGETEQGFKLCLITIRMQTETIPTMSEWGFLAVAVFMGAAGVWYLRRRQTA